MQEGATTIDIMVVGRAKTIERKINNKAKKLYQKKARKIKSDNITRINREVQYCYCNTGQERNLIAP